MWRLLRRRFAKIASRRRRMPPARTDVAADRPSGEQPWRKGGAEQSPLGSLDFSHPQQNVPAKYQTKRVSNANTSVPPF